MTAKDEKIIRVCERLCQTVPDAMTGMGLSRRTCIAHTRVAVELIRREKLRAEPLACKLVVLNASAYARAHELGRELNHDEYRPEDHSLGIGYGQGPQDTGYDAHVVTVVERRWLLDLTLDQANRPSYSIELRPGYFLLPDGFLAGDQGAPMILNGSYLRYTAMPDDRGFLNVPDWTLIRPTEPIMRRLLAAAG